MLAKGSNYEYNPNYQDWTPVIIGKIKNEPEQENITIPKQREIKVSSEMGLSIASARNRNQFSRKEVAKQCDIPVKLLQEWENGNGMINEKYMRKLSQMLNLCL